MWHYVLLIHKDFTDKRFVTDSQIISIGTIGDKQAALISGTSIKTINGNTLLGSGNLVITGGSSLRPTIATMTELMAQSAIADALLASDPPITVDLINNIIHTTGSIEISRKLIINPNGYRFKGTVNSQIKFKGLGFPNHVFKSSTPIFEGYTSDMHGHLSSNVEIIIVTQVSLNTNGTITLANHGFVNNSPVVYVPETIAYPNLIPYHVYYATNVTANTFTLSYSPSGAITTFGIPTQAQLDSKQYFSRETQNATYLDLNTNIFIKPKHNFSERQFPVRYDAQTTAITGLTNPAIYYVKYIDENRFYLTNADYVPIDLTAPGVGMQSLIFNSGYPPFYTAQSRFTRSGIHYNNGDKVTYIASDIPIGGYVSGQEYIIVDKGFDAGATTSTFSLSLDGVNKIPMTSNGSGVHYLIDAGISFVGDEYPKEISADLWDTGTTAVNERMLYADISVTGKPAHIFVSPGEFNNITRAILADHHTLTLLPGEYPNYFSQAGKGPIIIYPDTTIYAYGAQLYESSGNFNNFVEPISLFLPMGDMKMFGIKAKPMNLEFSDPSSHFISVGNASTFTIEDFYFEDCKSYCVMFGGYGQNAVRGQLGFITKGVFKNCHHQPFFTPNAYKVLIDNVIFVHDREENAPNVVFDLKPNNAKTGALLC